MRPLMIAAVLAAGLGLTACSDGYGRGDVALGYGYPAGDAYHGGYGYPASGYYDTGYGDYYDGAYGSPYWGWYGGFYYPGSELYVYDQYRRPFRWNGSQRRYWQGRSNGWHGRRGGAEWRGFDRPGGHAGARAGPAGIGSGGQGSVGYRGAPGSQGAARPAFQGAQGIRQPAYQNGGRPGFLAPQGNRQPAFQGARQPGMQGMHQSAPAGARSAGGGGGHHGGGGGGGGGRPHGGR